MMATLEYWLCCVLLTVIGEGEMARDSSSSWIDTREVDIEALEREDRRCLGVSTRASFSKVGGVVDDSCRGRKRNASHLNSVNYRDTYSAVDGCSLGTGLLCRCLHIQ